jgi:excisionase family DNA binding protein
MIESRFLDIQGVCKYIHLSRSSVYKMVSRNEIPFHKVGSRVLFDIHEIDRFVLNGGRKDEDIPRLPMLKVG